MIITPLIITLVRENAALRLWLVGERDIAAGMR